VSLVDTMDEARGASLTAVHLPRDPGPAPRSRTVQPQAHPNLARRYEVPSYALRVATIPFGRLALSGGVIDQAGALVMESLWDMPHFERDFAHAKRLAPVTKLSGVGASLITLWGNNYFHWMFNALPRLLVLEASGVKFDYLIVPENLRPFQAATLKLLGYEGDALVRFAGEHVQVEKLVWAAPLAPIDQPSRLLIDWVRSSLRAGSESSSNRRLYVSRQGGTRRAVNEDEIWARLEPLGYDFILPEEHSFEDQVKMFGQACIAVGSHGANLVNCVFSDRISVVECFQPEHVNPSVYSFLCAAGVDHWSLICERVRRRRGPKRFSGMKIAWSELEETLSRIERESGATI
jgi:hypothetical protein